MSFTLIIVVITVIITYLALQDAGLMNKLIMWPRKMDSPEQYYRLLTSGFIHADYMHLLFNMFTLYSFGSNVEFYFNALGHPFLFPVLYITGIIASSLPSYFRHKNDSYYRSLGASGGVSAVLFSAIYFAPWSKILVLIIPLPGIVAAVAYVVYSIYMDKKGNDNIGHDAHLWGAVYGFVFTLIYDPSHGGIFLQQLMHPHF